MSGGNCLVVISLVSKQANQYFLHENDLLYLCQVRFCLQATEHLTKSVFVDVNLFSLCNKEFSGAVLDLVP